MSFTFEVDQVEVASKPLVTTETSHVLKNLRGVEGIEAASSVPVCSSGRNAFLDAVWMAFDEHRPLSLSPDAVWLTITNSLAIHINENAETLRKKFVNHEGKKEIEVRRDGFVKGSPDNDWEGCFDEFSDKLSDYIGKKRDLIVCDFSTTGHVERAASEVVLMDAMQSYFRYTVRTMCGFPSITLEGTVEDWKKVRTKAQYMGEFNLDWWNEKLVPVLNEFVNAAEGNPDVDFWQSFLKIGGGSGGPYVTGWINVFFPYVVGYQGGHRRNGVLERWDRSLGRMGGGPNPSDFITGLSSVPFKWKYYGKAFDMEFVAGLVGVAQDEDGTIRPQAGWAVRNKNG